MTPPPDSSLSDDPNAGRLEALMASAMAGDGRAYAEVLRVVTSALKASLVSRVPPADRDDLIQNILLSIHKARHTYDPSRPLMPWVMAIARYRLQDHWRTHYRQRSNVTNSLDDALELPGADVTKGLEASEDIRRVAKSLPEKQQRIIGLMYGEDKSVQEVADTMKMSVSAVKVAAHRAYKTFRKKLKDE